jgi:large subunit ribosomal protein L29
MKLEDIQGKDTAELRGDLQGLHKELFQIKFRGAEETNNPSRHRQVRRTIARINTILRQRELAAASK